MAGDAWLLLCGGVGGAKLALGLDRLLPRGALTVLVNTGDDFTHLGLRIAPDLDTVMYTLAGLVNPDTGWGQREESWQFMAALDRLGGATWFRLGDRDLATHIERTRRLAAGEPLGAITADFCARLGIGSCILPMSDDPVATRLHTAQGWLDFQDYFVRERAAPRVDAIDYAGATQAALPGALAALLAERRLRGIVIAPSNPWLSIAPILALPGLRAALRAAGVPVIAVSPLIGGAAIKGPTAKLMAELGLPAGSAAIARFYQGIADVLVIDHADGADAPAVEALGLRAALASTLMQSLEDKLALARAVLDLARATPRAGRGGERTSPDAAP